MVKLTESIICGRTKVSALDMVRKLNCWGCDLDDIEILQQMPNVEVLSLSVNNIDALWPLSGCVNLRELYLRKNNIDDIRELRYLRRLGNLRILWLSENPCADYPDYRSRVLNLLPSLTTLDNRPVTEDELNAALYYGKLSAAAGDETNEEESIAARISESSPECDLPTPDFTNSNGGSSGSGGGNGSSSNGWKTTRVVRRPSDGGGGSGIGSRRSFGGAEVEQRASGGGNNGMSISCYAPNMAVESNGGGFGIRDGGGGGGRGATDRQSAWTSMNSLHHDSPSERNNGCFPGGNTTTAANERNARQSQNNQQRSNSTFLYDSPEPRIGFANDRGAWQQQRNNSLRSSGATNTGQSNNILVAIFTLMNELDQRGLESVISEAEQRLQRM